ncbi:hypothetical protein V1477_011007 [Vespula maculifrons]|uniref:Uncharacterized protein n=3 Tax=Vespula TaxID=7451 RepID=A0A834KS03_VESGE|nr:hypothetical protein HZH68_004540 [Vespula germanica]KAF7432073.1 hypothetical protein H0235_004997 [Vespula pensylvanica]
MNDPSLRESEDQALLPVHPNQDGGGSGWYASSSITESTFESLALDVSYAGLDVSSRDLVDHATSSYRETREGTGGGGRDEDIERKAKMNRDDLWEDIGVVDYLERKLGPPDESTPEERVEALREVLAETDIHEGDGDLSDFLFHIARTKHGRIYIRVIRTLLLNRGRDIVD